MEVPPLNVDVDLTAVLSQAGHGDIARDDMVPHILGDVEGIGVWKRKATYHSSCGEGLVCRGKQGDVGIRGFIEESEVH